LVTTAVNVVKNVLGGSAPPAGDGTIRWADIRAHVEFENSRHHDNRLPSVSILEHGKLHSFGATNEQAATKALLILHDPMSAAVSADAE
jgi:hypothetical protein